MCQIIHFSSGRRGLFRWRLMVSNSLGGNAMIDGERATIPA